MPTVDRNKLWRCAWVDPAGGPRAGQSQSGLSRAAIVVIGQDDLERVFILEAWAQRVAPDRLIDRILDTQQKWNPAVFGIDSSGPQLMFSQLVQKEAHERGIRIPLRPMALKSDKTFSIETSIQPVAASGRLIRPIESECRALKEEMTSFPDGMFRDTLDALACAIRLLPSIMPEHMKKMTEGQLIDYLKRTGMPPDQIATRVAQHREVG